MLRRIGRTALLLFALLPMLAEAAIARIDIVVSPNNTNLLDMAGGIEHALSQRWPNLSVKIAHSDNYAITDTQTTLIVAIGDGMLPWLSTHAGEFPFSLAFYVNSAAFGDINKADGKTSALYRDQPLSRQLELAKLLVPNLQRAAIIHSPSVVLGNLDSLERNSRVRIANATLRSDNDWAKILAQLMRDNDVLLGIDDPQIYNSNTIRSILLTTYRHGKVLIGPSRPFVNAGSLASCYTASDQYLQQLLTMIATTLQEQRVPRPQFPKAYRVAVNPQVAASLGLNLPNEVALTTMLQRKLGECGDDC